MRKIVFPIFLTFFASTVPSLSNAGKREQFVSSMQSFFQSVDNDRPRRALRLIDRIIRVYGVHPKFDYFKGHVLNMLGRYRQSAIFFRKCVRNTNRWKKRICPRRFIIVSRLSLKNIYKIIQLKKSNSLLQQENILLRRKLFFLSRKNRNNLGKRSYNRALVRRLQAKIHNLQRILTRLRNDVSKRNKVVQASSQTLRKPIEIQKLSLELVKAAVLPQGSVHRPRNSRKNCFSLGSCISLCERGNGKACCRASRFAWQRFQYGPRSRNRCIFTKKYYNDALRYGYNNCTRLCRK